MNETEFVKAYVAAFLGAWAANIYREGREGWQKGIVDWAPIEDATFQAEETFKRACDIQPRYFQSTDPSPDA